MYESPLVQQGSIHQGNQGLLLGLEIINGTECNGCVHHVNCQVPYQHYNDGRL